VGNLADAKLDVADVELRQRHWRQGVRLPELSGAVAPTVAGEMHLPTATMSAGRLPLRALQREIVSGSTAFGDEVFEPTALNVLVDLLRQRLVEDAGVGERVHGQAEDVVFREGLIVGFDKARRLNVDTLRETACGLGLSGLRQHH